MATTTSSTTLEALLKRDRLIVIGGLVSVIALAWAYILLGAGIGMSALEMTAMSQGGRATMEMAPPPPASEAVGGASMLDMAMAAMQPMAWTPGYAVLMFFMWWIMMVAMMLPSAAPMILLFAAVNRKQRAAGSPYVPTGIFAFGYLAVWAVFSLLATTAQWGLERTELLSSTMVGPSVVLGALLLIAAGVWQLTPLKHACLKHCRSPVQFLSHHWHKGRLGAFRMGIEHVSPFLFRRRWRPRRADPHRLPRRRHRVRGQPAVVPGLCRVPQERAVHLRAGARDRRPAGHPVECADALCRQDGRALPGRCLAGAVLRRSHGRRGRRHLSRRQHDAAAGR
jgi:predicted metal-binding membrane protein